MVRGKTSKPAVTTEDEPASKQPKLIKKSIVNHLNIPNRDTTFGQVLSCGTGDVGQLGLSDSVMEKVRPAAIGSLNDIVDVCAGGMHSLCLTKNGEVYTFGCNDEGALGRESSDDSEFTPLKINLPGKVVRVSAGDSHSAALLEDGRVFAWGSFRGSNGNMGLTLEGNKRFPIEVLPNIVSVDISSGGDHLVILNANGVIYTIGCGEQGQLGRISGRSASGTSRRGKTELLQPGIVYMRAEKLLADKIWTSSYCTFVRKMLTTEIYAFGLNNYNQLGLEKLCDPVFIPKLTKFTDVQEISGGQHHTIVLRNNGKCYVIGRKDYGRLGLGVVDKDIESLTSLKNLEKFKIKTVKCGDVCSFAITENDEVYGWGMGSNYQLGLGDDNDVDSPQLLTGKEVINKNVLKVSSGGQHSLFLVKAKEMNGKANGGAGDEEIINPSKKESKKTTKTDKKAENLKEDTTNVEDIQSKEITTTNTKKGRKKN